MERNAIEMVLLDDGSYETIIFSYFADYRNKHFLLAQHNGHVVFTVFLCVKNVQRLRDR